METKKILIIGKTGSGKSAFANLILGTEKFVASGSPGSCSREGQIGEVIEGNIKYVVLDTVGLCDTTKSTQEVLMDLHQTISLVKKEIHYIFFVTKDRFDDEAFDRFESILEAVFMGQVYNNTILVRPCVENSLQRGQRIRDLDLTAYMKEFPPKLKIVLDRVGQRWLFLHSASQKEFAHHEALFEESRTMVFELLSRLNPKNLPVPVTVVDKAQEKMKAAKDARERWEDAVLSGASPAVVKQRAREAQSTEGALLELLLTQQQRQQEAEKWNKVISGVLTGIDQIPNILSRVLNSVSEYQNASKHH